VPFAPFAEKAKIRTRICSVRRRWRIKWKIAAAKGATTVLLQGGHQSHSQAERLAGLHCGYPQRLPAGAHSSIQSGGDRFHGRSGECSVADALHVLWDAGIRTIPGGGAEILTEAVRKIIAPRKATTDQWLDVCEKAHRIGFKTTATMMFGHVETDDDIIGHLLRLRDLQDLTGGFTSFIPWSFKPGRTPLARQVKHPAHPAKYVRIIAVARLVLDNFPHIQSSWFSENISAGQLGLLAGADDFGGVLVEEHVHKEAGHDRQATVENVLTIIRRAGFTPARRDSFYRTQETFAPPAPVGAASPIADR
jgi:cyclic dehypoxanthinyl futalosine synthase